MSDIREWNVEDEKFWESTGKKIANRNLWISIPSLLCGFAVWLYWGVITVQMLNLGFPFAKSELFTLMAIAGLTGATLRIPSSFFIRLCGGRNTLFFTTALLMIPAVGAGIALSDQNTPLWVFQLLALLSGFGGGNFASSMSNINFFFPKKVQGLALGLNAGLGNFGVTTMQILVPLAMTFGLFGAMGGDSMVLQNMVTRHNAGEAWPLPPKKIQLRILPKARHHRRQILPDVTWQLPQRSRQQATKKRLSHLDVARLSFKCCSPPSPSGTSRSTVVVAQPFCRQLIQVSSHQ